MRITTFIFRASPRLYVLTVVFGILTGITNATLITMITRALYNAGARTTRFILIFFGLCLLTLVVGSVSQIALGYLSRKAMAQLRMKLCEKIIAAPLSQLEEMGTHRLIVALRDDTTTIAVGIGQLPLLYMQLGVVFVCTIYLAWLSLPLLLGVIVFTTLGVLSYQIPLRVANRHMRAARENEDQVSYFFSSILEGIKELKLSNARRYHLLRDQIVPYQAKIDRSYAMGWGIYTIANAWGRLLIFALLGILVLLLAPMMNLQAQVIISFAIMILYMSGYIQGVLNLVPILSQGRVAMQKLERLGLSLTAETQHVRFVEGRSPIKKWKSIEFQGVVHRYHRENDGESFMMGPLNLALTPGEILFVVGGNGSGKTTFAKLLTSLYKPEEGTLLFDGKPVTDEKREDYREYFATVFSDSYVFETLIGDTESAPDIAAKKYLERLQLQHKVQVADSTLTSVSLSSGQRKRLALLTAYLQNRPIYLFDEWAADQDPEFKRVFYDELLPELKSRGITSIVISHDQHYYSRADRIVEFNEGQIVLDNKAAVPQEPITVGRV